MSAATQPISVIARLLDLSERRIQQLSREGVIPKAERGQYDLIGSVRGYVRYLRDQALKAQAGAPDYALERARFIRARADLAEMEAEEKRRSLIAAELIAPSRYRLTRLLRGQRGTGHAIGNPAPAGARVVVLDTTLASLPIAEADLGLPWNWRVGPAARAVSDASYAALGFTPTGRGLVPFAPVHVEQPWRIARSPGDLTIRWTRRSRRRSPTSRPGRSRCGWSARTARWKCSRTPPTSPPASSG